MNLISFIILLPLLGFLLLAFSQGRWSNNVNTIIGVGSVGLAAILTARFLILNHYYANTVIFYQYLWTWISVDAFRVVFALSIDGLSLTMLSIITGVGFLIHLYASWYMEGEEGYSRFFAYTNLFIANMVLLVLADNLLLMYFGWEGVGLCSYLLIGFYHTNKQNNNAAIKAFIITRIGDVLLALALFLLYAHFGTLNIHDLIFLAEKPTIANNSQVITWATLLILGGAAAKSAQLPLQTWLADAMVGPTPVSALIHAATMVTAGVYLIARTHSLFLLTPDILNLVGLVGAMTLVMACLSALVQTDLKKILAYSTMSQIGYMFLALGTQVWDGAIIHLMTHAFFKALLFLCSGIVILNYHREQNIFKIGGLRQSLPFIYISLLVGCLALSAMPLVTAGFFSKEKILCGALSHGNSRLMLVGLLGEFLTSMYTFRMFFVLCYGEKNIKASYLRKTSISYYVSLVTLLILSTFISTLIVPPLTKVLPISNLSYNAQYLLDLDIVSSTITIIGIVLAAILWLGKHRVVNLLSQNKLGRVIFLLLFHAWGFDWLYEQIFVKPYLAIAKILAFDPIDALMNIPAVLNRWLVLRLKLSFNSKLRWYVISMCLGALIVMIILVFSSLFI
ncbi:NADH-quinone oxidoreductase subunit L [Candidatus Palibaumannia cicadellinicola]|uniref:Proton-translocating NADH-quinone oxidoreductase, chain L n=1 Tax=Baumannia cicadellinicola subsp. Homalodisca coagulata TaxID=374463 RepID=Q1LT99_BAUCH|nr:NADH-quinone oxidoreductase subunit L [Candidatus Baumannia cicadellinicola]ABF13898.1 proton-translocating NADH-quinone oxidoreductase, chain L [Baumannia cicadellinicola str. Hc (Homalodisca coagulata)]MCJ7462204.1 NADH-quinone oxidoreductase subunit L [Candidatus Baumannia cicadellinicola]MCJ7462722.1 NADH-quinone oxidoreductase subunit L [Candidatus Baumannia cicadellinicola]